MYLEKCLPTRVVRKSEEAFPYCFCIPQAAGTAGQQEHIFQQGQWWMFLFAHQIDGYEHRALQIHL